MMSRVKSVNPTMMSMGFGILQNPPEYTKGKPVYDIDNDYMNIVTMIFFPRSIEVLTS